MSHLVDSRTRPLRFRFRPDLNCRLRDEGERRCWIVSDPLARRHYLLEEEEYFLATCLDGVRSLAEIEFEFEKSWPTYRFSVPRFQVFVARLHNDGLLWDDSLDLSRVLNRRRRASGLRAWLAAPSKLLAYRFPGFNPDQFLEATYPWVRWCFSPWAALGAALLMACALGIVLIHPAEVAARMPEIKSWLTPERVAYLAIVLASTKVLHELGHAYACRHFGGRCREIGVMLLVFTPCLYCDVSDTVLIAGKWRRAAVAAAGMCVECVFAAACTVIWWNTESEWLGRWCLLFMGVSGASTLIFNGNPLLRYDGYFLLSDLMDVPNLWQRSRAVARDALSRWCLGTKRRSDEAASERSPRWLGLYAVASESYRIVVTCACLLFVWQLFESWRLERLGWLATIFSTGGAFLPVMAIAHQRLSDPGWRREVSPSRLTITVMGVLASLLVVLLVPLPSHVVGPALLQVEDAAPLYVSTSGVIRDSREPGTRLAQGEVVATLENPELERERVRWLGEVAVHEARVAYLESVRGDDSQAGSLLPAALEALEAARELAQSRQEKIARLSLVAPIAGELLPPPHVPASDGDTQNRVPGQSLAKWSGTPLDVRNRGAHLESGTLVGWIGDPSRLEAVVYLSETEVERVSVGNDVRLCFAAWPGDSFRGVVREIAQEAVDEVPRELTVGDDTLWRPDKTGVPRFAETTYRAKVSLDVRDLPQLNRVRGAAKIEVSAESLVSRVLRNLRKSFAWMP